MSLRLSGKNLAELALPEVCPSCFKMKVTLSMQGSIDSKTVPFQMPMPGIFSNIDTHIKKVVKHFFETHGRLPDWFPDIGQKIIAIEDPPGWQNFNIYSQKYNLRLTGALDTIFKLEDGSYALGDYKTARFSETHDKLMPMYKAQLHAYKDIALRLGIFQPVSKLFLIYTEPIDYIHEENNYNLSDFEEIFKLHFKVTPKIFDVEPGLTEGLIEKALMILNDPIPGSSDNCPNCILRERLFQQETVEKNKTKINTME